MIVVFRSERCWPLFGGGQMVEDDHVGSIADHREILRIAAGVSMQDTGTVLCTTKFKTQRETKGMNTQQEEVGAKTR